MRSLLLAAAVTPFLSGCFFVFIPGALIDKVAGAPKYCVQPSTKVGDNFTKDGDTYRVTEIVGDSQYYCRNNPEWRRLGVNAEVLRPDGTPAPVATREYAPSGPGKQ